ncbi:MAG: TolC family protein, partial [Longimicrobiales bacterium]
LGTAAGVSAQEEPSRDASLASLLEQAEARNPEVLAARRSAEAAAARVPQAGALPDPVLGFGVINFPVANPSFGREMMTMTTIQVGETFPLFGKLGLREDVARHEGEAAEWEVERARQNVLADVKAAYYEIYFVDRALQVTGRNEMLVGDFARLTATKYGVGAGVQPDVLKAQVERTRLDDQLVALRERRVSAAARLNALLDRPTDTPVPSARLPERVRVAALANGGEGEAIAFTSDALGGAAASAEGARVAAGRAPAPGIPTVTELQQLALQHNPMIQAHVRRIAAQRSALSLAGKAKLPDFNVSVAYSRRPDFADFVNLMVSVPVPIFAGRKQDQAVIEQAAMLAQHQATHTTMVNQLNDEIASLAAELRRARDQLVLLNDGILPQARTSLASSTSSYRVGNVDFLTLLDAQVTLFRHELDYHRLLADFATNVANLERAVGTEVLQ